MTGVISTLKTNCKDCYKCLRSCPVKAIKVVAGHAQVVPERCIGDAECVRVCPQHAKVVREDLPLVKRWLARGERVVLSLAPSFAGCLPWDFETLKEALLKRKVAAVEETALGAALVAKAHRDLGAGPWLTSACPAVVKLVEIYFPHLLPYLAPVVSPMIAHGRLIKSRDENAKVVFVGPCVAKKGELLAEGLAGAVDAALTFQELTLWLADEDLPAAKASGSVKSVKWGERAARFFPVDGGQLATMGQSQWESGLAISGMRECLEFLQHFEPEEAPRFTELLACRGGCIAGPMSTAESFWQAKKRLLAYAQRPLTQPAAKMDLTRTYRPEPICDEEPTEAQLEEILKRMGKYAQEDELNCGACGYNSCREKAKAVFNGMAEVQMCIPNMRARAESLANLVLSSTPNGIIVTDEDLLVLDLNPQAEQMFSTTSGRMKNKPLELILDPVYFAQAVADNKPVQAQTSYDGLVTSQYIFGVPKHRIVVGIFTDITVQTQQKREMEELRQETVGRAQEVIQRQMRVAQEIAGLLGETTAQTKVLLTKLIQIIGRGDE
jgi:iron only hydrogenase large subunit-like protein